MRVEQVRETCLLRRTLGGLRGESDLDPCLRGNA